MTHLGIGGLSPASYKTWIRAEALKIGSDGCSMSLDIYTHCCYEHDLGYYYGRDPREAVKFGWHNAQRISKREVDKRFRACNPDWLRYRWWAVVVGGWRAWNRHRRQRP